MDLTDSTLAERKVLIRAMIEDLEALGHVMTAPHRILGGGEDGISFATFFRAG
jgi:hypothetical protein